MKNALLLILGWFSLEASTRNARHTGLVLRRTAL
jgi:hypothetical protein